jgi:hypothetical protein
MNMTNEDLQRKLKRERTQICLNCKHFVECDEVGKFEECANFVGVEDGRQVVIVSLDEYARLSDRLVTLDK